MSNQTHEQQEKKGKYSNQISLEIKTEKTLGINITRRNFTLILSNVQSIKNKQDLITKLLDDSNANLAILTETRLTDADVIWMQGWNFAGLTIELMNAIGETNEEEDWNL